MKLNAFSDVSVAKPTGRLRWAGAAVLTLAAFGPGVALAQGLEAPSASLGGADKPFTVGVQAITSFETNPAHGNAENAAARHITGDEITLSPSITADYSHSVGAVGVALTGNFGYDYHTKNDLLSREHLNFAVVGNKAIGAFCSGGGDAAFSQSQSDLQYLTVNVTKNTLQTYRVGVSQTCSTSSGLTESLQIFTSGDQNSSSSLVDFGGYGASAMLGYSNHAIGFAGVTVTYNRTNYGHAPVTSTTTPDVLEVKSVGLQINRPIGARLSGSASVSYSESDEQLRPGAPVFYRSSFSGLTYSFALTYALGHRLNLATDISRHVSGSILPGVGFSVATTVGFTADYTLSSRVSANVGVNWSQIAYQGRDPLIQTATPAWQDTTVIHGTVQMKLGSRAGVGLTVRHYIGNSDLGLYDYASDYAGVTLSTSF